MVLWFYGPMDLWIYGSMILWIYMVAAVTHRDQTFMLIVTDDELDYFINSCSFFLVSFAHIDYNGMYTS
jgi:hypothetical protein